jgi:light-regulated signal transduction histidine kinase (bacteriophytochrome)
VGIKTDKNLTEAAELRRQAEERLQASASETEPPRTEHETQRCLHELQVHQLELEMQNAQLQQARDEMEAALKKYSDLCAELENRVRERVALLQESYQNMETFCYSVSHDLRTPLRAIDGYLRIFSEKYTTCIDTEGNALLGRVHVNIHRMGQLIDDLLTFSRLGESSTSLAMVDMRGQTEDICNELLLLVPERHINFTIGDLKPVVCDQAMIRQVLFNLISNAIKFTATRGEAAIEIASSQNDSEIVYRVTDNGIGFEMEYAGKIFGVFDRLNRLGEFEGSGVGLAIVKRIIEKHGGRAWAESSPGNGATFFFSLPRSPHEGIQTDCHQSGH